MLLLGFLFNLFQTDFIFLQHLQNLTVFVVFTHPFQKARLLFLGHSLFIIAQLRVQIGVSRLYEHLRQVSISIFVGLLLFQARVGMLLLQFFQSG